VLEVATRSPPASRAAVSGLRTAAGGRLAGIEGARALAAGSILVFHCWLFGAGAPGLGSRAAIPFENLALGVTLFFTLSGFLLYRPFAAAIMRGRPHPATRDYMMNRALRILPAYWVILALTALVLGTVNVRSPAGELQTGRLTDLPQLAGSAAFVTDYHPSGVLIGIGPAWSLAVEVVFYLALPILVAIGAAVAAGRDRRGRRRALLLPPLLLLLVGWSGKFVAGVVVDAAPIHGWSTDWHSVIERSFWAQADLFTFGMILAVARVDAEDGRLRLGTPARIGCAVAGALILIACGLTFHGAQLSYLPQNTAAALGCALLLATVVLPQSGGDVRSAPARWLEAPPLVAGGLISYSVFLWHEPLVHWLEQHGLTAGGWSGLALTVAVAGALTALLATVTYRWVERPALARKRSYGGSPAVSEAAP
jgi:peptidoglycan/LPS O-acetylase OafA/YrhL